MRDARRLDYAQLLYLGALQQKNALTQPPPRSDWCTWLCIMLYKWYNAKWEFDDPAYDEERGP